MPRVNVTKKNKAGKAIKCGKCGAKIQAGEQYRHWTFRFGGKHIRCMKPDCAPRASDLTQGRIGDVYRITEAVEDAAAQFQSDLNFDAFESEIETQAKEARSLADEFQSSFDNMPEGLQQGDTGQLLEQRVEALNSYADELESAISSARGTWESVGDEPDEGDEDDARDPVDVADEIANEITGISCDAD